VDYGPIITIGAIVVGGIAGGGVSWGLMTGRVKALENKASALEGIIQTNKDDRVREINEIKLEQDKAIYALRDRDIKEIRERHDREIETVKTKQDTELSALKKDVLWRGECDRCNDKWSSIVGGIKESLAAYAGETNRRLDEIATQIRGAK
jgi:hypothetical protein